MSRPARFQCPSCKSEQVLVYDSRLYGTVRSRRYRCQSCDERFITAEMEVKEGDEFHVRATGRGTKVTPMTQWLARRVERAKIAIEDAFKGA